MKYTSYILTFIWIFLLFNIFLSFSSASYRLFLRDTKTKIVGVKKEDNIDEISKSQLEINSKILTTLDKLNNNIENLKEKESKEDLEDIKNNILNRTNSWKIIGSGEILENEEKELKNYWELDIPDSLLAKLMPEIIPSKINNSWIFGIKDDKFFDKLEYITLKDDKKRVNIYVFNNSYHQVLSNFKMMNIYNINETNTFYWYSFFLNPKKTDIKIRFVTLIEAKAVWFEVEKNRYEELKKELLK